MKKIVVIAGIMLAGAFGASAQGVVWNGQDVADNRVWHLYSPQAGSPGTEVQGNISVAFSGSSRNGDLPAGNTVYTGSLIGGSSVGSGSAGYANGANYDVALYGAVGTVSDMSSLVIVPGSTTSIGTTSTKTGLITQVNPDPVVPGSTYGGTATVQARAWYKGDSGQFTTYDAALAAGVPTGYSILSTVTLAGNPSLQDPFPTFTSFSLTSGVPEPSTIALGVMGASAFLMRRRMSK